MSREKLRKKNKDIAIISVTIALIIVLQTLAEVLRLIGLQFSFALGLIPVLVIAQLRGPKVGTLAGLAFGLTSMTIAAIKYSAVPVWRNVINPLISVLPRVIVGLVVALVAGALNKVLDKRASEGKSNNIVLEFAFSAVATLTGVLLNTIGFLGMFYAFSAGQTVGGYTIDLRYILTMVVAINTVVEIAVFVVIVPAIVSALKRTKIFNDKKEANAIREEMQTEILENDTQNNEVSTTDRGLDNNLSGDEKD
ncbi:MAG TPA: ECF transporter S component [Clostridia bacterium]|jgi:uncharacterized membrane protein|nr:ECF transporter S component [Clostridia bacterium]